MHIVLLFYLLRFTGSLEQLLLLKCAILKLQIHQYIGLMNMKHHGKCLFTTLYIYIHI